MSEHVHMADASMIPPLPGSPAMPPPQPQFGVPAPDIANGIPIFEMVAKRYADGTYVNVEFVSILTPGDAKAIARHKVTDRIRQIYKQRYEAFRNGLKMAPNGTPLEMWPVTTPAQVQALKAVNIFTVEELVQVADANLYQIPFGRTLRNQAEAWLKAKKDSDAVEGQRRETDTLRDGMRMLEEQIAVLNAKLAEKGVDTESVGGQGPVPAEGPRRGRPPNPKPVQAA